MASADGYILICPEYNHGPPAVLKNAREHELTEGFEYARAGQARGLDGERARALVERGGHGEHDVLLGQRRVGEVRVPRRLHMGQIAGAGRHGRDLGDVLGRAPGQDGRRAVHTGVREPALGAADQTSRHLGAQLARRDPPRGHYAAGRLAMHAKDLPAAAKAYGAAGSLVVLLVFLQILATSNQLQV